MLQPEHDVGGFKAVIFKFIINPCASILCFYPTLAAPSWGRNSPSEGDKRTAPPTPVHQHRPGLGRVRSPHRPGLLSSNARLCSKGHKAETGRPRALQGRERGLQCGRLSHPGPGFPLTATSFPPDLHLRVPSQSLRTQSPEAQAAAGSLGKAVSCPSRVPDIPAGHRLPLLLAPRGLRTQQEPRHRLRTMGDSSSRHACSASPPPHSRALGASPLGTSTDTAAPARLRAHTSSATVLTGASWIGEDDAHL